VIICRCTGKAIIYGRAGVELERSTLADWGRPGGVPARAPGRRHLRHVRAGATLHADDTPVPVLDPGRGRTKTGRLWVLVRDERPARPTGPNMASYRKLRPDHLQDSPGNIRQTCVVHNPLILH
jgi:transposase